MKLLLIALVALTASLGAAEGGYADIGHDELAKLVAAKQVVVIDVNGTESYQAGHIPGALDWQAIKDAPAKALPADKATLIVAYCGNEKCGAYKRAADAAAALGYTNVKHYSKGIAGWKAASAPVEAAPAPAKQN